VVEAMGKAQKPLVGLSIEALTTWFEPIIDVMSK
jgi:hypothetical protein